MTRHLAILLVVAVPLFFGGINAVPFRDPDEGLYGAIAREMVERRDWVTPRFNGLRYLEKPPLYDWLTALTYLTFGFSEWGARLWTAIGALGTVLVTAMLGLEAFGRRVGVAAGLIYATSLGIFLYGRFAGTDILFTFFVTSAFLFFLRWIRSGRTTPLFSFYVLVALAILTKAALGLLLPLLVVGGVFSIIRPRPRLRDLGLWWGILLLLALVLPWHVQAARGNHGFVSYYLVETHLVRFLQGTGAIEDEAPLSTMGFLLVSLVWFLPWSMFLPSALVSLGQKWSSLPRSERTAWTVIHLWAAIVFGLFSVSAFKLEHYALPAFPALALLVAHLWFQEHPRGLIRVPLALGTMGALALSGIAFRSGGLLGFLSLGEVLSPFNVYFRMLLEQGLPLPLPPRDFLQVFFREIAVTLLLGFGTAALACWRGAIRTALGCLLLGTTGFLLAVGALLIAIAPYQSVKSVAEAIQHLASPADLVLYEGYLEDAGGLPYYAGRQIHVLGPARGDLAFGSRFPEAKGLFHSTEDLPRLWQSPRRVFLVTDRPPELSAAQILPAERRHLLVLDHGKRLYSNQVD